MTRLPCNKIRILGKDRYRCYFDDSLMKIPERRESLRRTFDTWGNEAQSLLMRLQFGIVGVGSVGSIVAEALARIGVTRITLIDPDVVEAHNLDRLIHSTTEDIGSLKVDVSREGIQASTTAETIDVISISKPIQTTSAYLAALDCDFLFSCVDRPVARDVLNHIANSHLIPVIDGGVAIEMQTNRDILSSAHWRAHIISPYHRCLRCNGQYNTSMVVMELDGSLDDPSYVTTLEQENRGFNQNVFPFSMSVASMEINLMIRYIIALDWWPTVKQQDYQFVTSEIRIINDECHSACAFIPRRGIGDLGNPDYLESDVADISATWYHRLLARFRETYRRFRRAEL